MTSRANWVRREETKIPVRADNGRNASATNPATWTTHSAARKSTYGVGLGYVLRADDGIVCVDLDNCIDANGTLSAAARRFLDACPSTYIEVSVSGRGLHIFGFGSVPRGRRIRNKGLDIEVYGDARYIAVTGRRLESSPLHFSDLSGVTNSL